MGDWKTIIRASGVGAWKDIEREVGTGGWKALYCQLAGYTYYKKGAVNATTAGAQTLYQLKLIVGESSGAAGADVHCENHCLDFPNDVRFTKEDGETKHDYWIEEITGTTPNRKATVWIKVASIPASGSVDFYMYYRKASDSGESSGDNTFELFDDFDAGEWTPYSGNPVLSPEGSEDYTTFASVLKVDTTYHMYYHYYNAANYEQIGHATSSDGKSWVKDSANNPVLTASVAWESSNVGVPMVWKEGSTWYMLYRGKSGVHGDSTGLATSADGVSWAKDASNPVRADEVWGIIKVGSTYYAYFEYNSDGRQIHVATSANLTSWTDIPSGNPILTGGRFCPFAFKRGSYYYLLVPHYTAGTDYSELELYRDTAPTFLPANRTFMGVRKRCDSGQWDGHDQDTPCVLTDTISRDTFPSDERWTYYSAEGPTGDNIWEEGLLIETDIDAALVSNVAFSKWVNEGSWSIDNNIKKYGTGSASSGIGSGRKLYKNFSPGKIGIMKDMWVRTKHTGWCHVFYDNTLLFMSGHGGHWQYNDGAWHNFPNDKTFVADTWYRIQIAWTEANKYKAWVDGFYLGEVTTIAYSSITKIQSMNYTTVGYNLWLDNVLVRKYASPEPTWGTWGSEQS
jgi:hypothetical protein